MEDHLGSANCGVGTLIRAKVTFDDVEVQPLEPLPPARGEIVEDADLVTIGNQPAYKVVADEPCAPSDEGTRWASVISHRYEGEANKVVFDATPPVT